MWYYISLAVISESFAAENALESVMREFNNLELVVSGVDMGHGHEDPEQIFGRKENV